MIATLVGHQVGRYGSVVDLGQFAKLLGALCHESSPAVCTVKRRLEERVDEPQGLRAVRVHRIVNDLAHLATSELVCLVVHLVPLAERDGVVSEVLHLVVVLLAD